MSQTTQHDLIGIADVAAKIPAFISKVPNLLSGLKQAYLRTPNTSAGLGIAFEKAVKRNPKVMRFILKSKNIPITNSMNGPIKLVTITLHSVQKKVM